GRRSSRSSKSRIPTPSTSRLRAWSTSFITGYPTVRSFTPRSGSAQLLPTCRRIDRSRSRPPPDGRRCSSAGRGTEARLPTASSPPEVDARGARTSSPARRPPRAPPPPNPHYGATGAWWSGLLSRLGASGKPGAVHLFISDTRNVGRLRVRGLRYRRLRPAHRRLARGDVGQVGDPERVRGGRQADRP